MSKWERIMLYVLTIGMALEHINQWITPVVEKQHQQEMAQQRAEIESLVKDIQKNKSN